jgi:hypothetical protein
MRHTQVFINIKGFFLLDSSYCDTVMNVRLFIPWNIQIQIQSAVSMILGIISKVKLKRMYEIHVDRTSSRSTSYVH